VRLNWFSPLPPVKSGIADYTQRLLPALTAAAEIVLWTDQESWDPAVEDYAKVRSYRLQEMPWAEVNGATMSIFHIGNNHRFHGPIWQVSQRHAGLVILHDVALQQFFAGLFREQWHDRTGYLELMEHFYGAAGRQDAEDFWAGRLTIEYMAEQYRLTRYAIDPALGALVHSQRTFEELRHDSPCPLSYARLPYPVTPPGSRGKPGMGSPRAEGPPYRLIVFGHLSDNRRLGSVLRALAKYPKREDFRLDIYGELWDHRSVGRDIEDLGLQTLVTPHGFVPAEALEEALASAHLAINLRFPTMGEASVSQLQIWDHALPSLVTRVGWYATLPQETVAFVRPEHEITDIQAHLQAFIDNPGHYAHLGEDGRRFLQAYHTPGAYVQALLDAVADAEAFRPEAMAHHMARRVGQEMRRWTKVPAPDITSSLWGHVVGSSQAEGDMRKPTQGLDYRHAEALKCMREELSEEVKRLQQQLSTGLQAVRRAASEECYAPAQQQGIPFRSPPSQADVTVPNLLTAASITPVEAHPHCPRDELSSPAKAGSGGSQTTAHTPPVVHHAMGEGDPKKPYFREGALSYPLSIAGHDTGFRDLFYLMIVAKSLGLRPGDSVLDFGAGSCYVSELLNRFGYITVALDNDPEVLAIGHERLSLDPRCDRERAKFVTGDGTCLPFRDASFDGIVCMNALHHMPDYRATLAEMFRVLKAGGRAAFAEPGDEHSKSPESILAMEQYGALEKDVVLSEVYQLAREAGFQRMALKPYVLPEMVELDYQEFDRFKQGGEVSGAFLTAQEIAEFARGHPLFYLEKGGERTLTSATAPTEKLRARILIQECSRRVYQGGSMKVVALCENVGESIWLSTPQAFGGFVTFGVKLLTPEGRVLEDNRGRQRLRHDVPPGGRIEVVSEVPLEGFKPGSYRVLFDMVNELVCWFQGVGSDVVERWIEIV
jgi:ubiquinone/menaquinone biosynthesis C-methylase UbiE/glycosyltransferase involved in cell wall biosynthesis